jgi:general secretion pathway protein C
MNSRITRRLIIVAYLVTTTFVVAHSINAFVENELLAGTSTSASDGSSQAAAIPAARETPVELAERIKTSGLFPLPAQLSAVSVNGAPVKPPKPPLNVAQKLRLLGTVLDNHGGGFAVTEDIASKQQHLVHLHEVINSIGEVSEIRHDGIVIRQDDQEELLGLALLQGDGTRPTQVAPVNPQPASTPQKRTLDRREVMEAVSDPTKLMMQAHAVPFIVNGTFSGFRLDFIAPQSFFEKAGFQYGDVIKRINGVEIRDPGRLLASFQQVVNERTVKVDLVRASQNTTLTYELR